MGHRRYEKVSVFVLTRKMIRDRLRKQYGNKGLSTAWRRYQEKNYGKRGKEECDVLYDCKLAKEKMKELPRLPNVSYEVWGWHDGKGWIIQEGEGI